MTIEIQRGKSLYQYKINEYQPREIDYRVNRHNARWYRFDTYDTPEIAYATLLRLEAGTDSTGTEDTTQ